MAAYNLRVQRVPAPEQERDLSPLALRSDHRFQRVALTLLRLDLGVLFLWAFLAKLFGLGYATPAARAWLHGGSPTKGFLSRVNVGPLQGVFTAIAGQGWVDWLFMLGLLAIGLTMLLGIGVRLGARRGDCPIRPDVSGGLAMGHRRRRTADGIHQPAGGRTHPGHLCAVDHRGVSRQGRGAARSLVGERAPRAALPLAAVRGARRARSPWIDENRSRALVFLQTLWGESGSDSGDHDFFVGTARVLVHNSNGPCGTIADAIAQARTKLSNLTEREINQQAIGPQQVQELSTFFGRGVKGAQARAANFILPASLDTDTLLSYAVVAERAIAKGTDTLGVQAERLALIRRALEQRGYQP